MSLTIYGKCERCHKFNALNEWGSEDLCRACIDEIAAEMGNGPPPPVQQEAQQ